jgi:hypothetical protein
MRIDVPEWFIWNNPEYDKLLVSHKLPTVAAVNIFDHTDGECIAYVFDDGGRVHFAIQLGVAVIAVEHIPENCPATSIAFYASVELWKKAVMGVDWIVAGLREGCLGFPACDLADGPIIDPDEDAPKDPALPGAHPATPGDDVEIVEGVQPDQQ